MGDARLGDRLEKLAYNALPATFKKDMTAHQYDQQCNQVICSKQGEHLYVNNGADSNLYGLEPNFGCCTANLHQGWPKFVSHLWMATPDGGLAAVAYTPCIVETKIQGKPVKVELKTEYPFRDTIEVVVTAPEEVTFPLQLRLPEWSDRPEIKGSGFLFVQGDAEIQADSFEMKIDSRPEHGFLKIPQNGKVPRRFHFACPCLFDLYHGFNDSVAIERGPLVYALPIGAEWKKVKDNAQFADWEVYPTTPWNYALEIDCCASGSSVTFEERPVGSSPFSVEGAPVVAQVKGRRLPGWTIEKGAAAPPPKSPVKSEAVVQKLTLIPYGCTDLRITEFPTVARR